MNFGTALDTFKLGRKFAAKVRERYRLAYGDRLGLAKSFGFGGNREAFWHLLKRYRVNVGSIRLRPGDILKGFKSKMSKSELLQKLKSHEPDGFMWNLPKLRDFVAENSLISNQISFSDLLTGLGLWEDFIREFKKVHSRSHWLHRDRIADLPRAITSSHLSR